MEEVRHICPSCDRAFRGYDGVYCGEFKCRNNLDIRHCDGCNKPFIPFSGTLYCEACELTELPCELMEIYNKVPEKRALDEVLPPVLAGIVLLYTDPKERYTGLELTEVFKLYPSLSARCHLFTSATCGRWGVGAFLPRGNERRRHWLRFERQDRQYELILNPIEGKPAVAELMRNSAYAHVVKAYNRIAWVCNGDSVELSQCPATFRLIC